MQELISQIAAAGIKITPTTSLIIIFGIIFLTAIVVHLILHKVVLRTFEKRAQATPLRVEKLARDQLQMRTTTPAITQYVPLPVPRASEGAR